MFKVIQTTLFRWIDVDELLGIVLAWSGHACIAQSGRDAPAWLGSVRSKRVCAHGLGSHGLVAIWSVCTVQSRCTLS